MSRTRRLPRGYEIRGGELGKADARADYRATAVHEAGHAVTAHALGERVVRIEVTGRRTGACYTEYAKRRGRVDPVARAVVALAGHEAEHRVCGRPIQLLPAGDLQTVHRLGCSATSVDLVGWVARAIVRRHDRQIRYVAAALLAARGRRLGRRQFLAVMRECDG